MAALLALTVVNCLGVAMGTHVQSALMVLKIAAIATLIVCGWLLVPPVTGDASAAPLAGHGVRALFAFGAAMAPVLFAYGGWQTASFVSGELRDPQRDLPRGLLLGVSGVIVLYLGVNWVCVRALGGPGLAQTLAPASAVMERALGAPGARLIAAGIAISTFGFLDLVILVTPRVLQAMAADGVFLPRLAVLHPRYRTPALAIVFESAWAIVLTLTGTFAQLVDYVSFGDWIFFGLTVAGLYRMRARDARAGETTDASARTATGFHVPGYPWTPAIFVLAAILVVTSSIRANPRNAAIGTGLLLLGVPVYLWWRRPPAAVANGGAGGAT